MEDLVLVHSSDLVLVHEDDLAHFGVKGMKWGRRTGTPDKTPEQRKASFKKGAKIAGSVSLVVGASIATAIIANKGSNKISNRNAEEAIKTGADFINTFSLKNGIFNADLSGLNR